MDLLLDEPPEVVVLVELVELLELLVLVEPDEPLSFVAPAPTFEGPLSLGPAPSFVPAPFFALESLDPVPAAVSVGDFVPTEDFSLRLSLR